MSDLQYGVSNKGGQTVIYRGFEYIRHRQTAKGTIHWRCAKFRRYRCRSLLHTCDYEIIREPSEHCHTIFEARTHRAANDAKKSRTKAAAAARSVIASHLVQESDGIKIKVAKKQSTESKLCDFVRTLKMSSTTLEFRLRLTQSDPQENPVLIVGQVKHLNQLCFEHVEAKLAPRVSADHFKKAIASLQPSPGDSCSLYLNLAILAALPVSCSRHNTSSRAHILTKCVQNFSVGVTETIVVVCERSDLYASACAVARAYPLYSRKTSNYSDPATVSVEFIFADEDETEFLDDYDTIEALNAAAHGIRTAAKIVDAPCNEMNVDGFLEEVHKVGAELGITPTIIRGEELKTRGFGGIYGVGKAATSPPALAVLSHTPCGQNLETIAWVGKGIVYDTGGLSIKGKTMMPGMKRDCGGAAGVLGAFYAAVKNDFTQNLHAVFCLAENAVGPNATRPDDIHTLYSGRTVEINNTDAEGRLVLADGVVYAKRDLKANVIVDMATLTGAQGIATGKYHAAILSNNEQLELEAVHAGRISGDLTFPLPYCPEMHFSEFASSVADMKNSVADRGNAQTSCAGLFIASHLGFDYSESWLHIDMAAPAYCGERATGYGVALLTTLFGKYMRQSILNSFPCTANKF